jgi:hypothetical protein
MTLTSCDEFIRNDNLTPETLSLSVRKIAMSRRCHALFQSPML